MGITCIYCYSQSGIDGWISGATNQITWLKLSNHEAYTFDEMPKCHTLAKPDQDGPHDKGMGRHKDINLLLQWIPLIILGSLYLCLLSKEDLYFQCKLLWMSTVCCHCLHYLLGHLRTWCLPQTVLVFIWCRKLFTTSKDRMILSSKNGQYFERDMVFAIKLLRYLFLSRSVYWIMKFFMTNFSEFELIS